MSTNDDVLFARYRSMSDAHLVLELERTDERSNSMVRAELQSRGSPEATTVEGNSETGDHADGPVYFDSDSRLMTLARYLNVTEARIHCALLQAENIKAVVADEHTAITDNFIFYALGGVRLQVPANNCAAARQILAEVRSGQRMLSDELYDSLSLSSSEPVPMTREQFLFSYVLLVGLSGLLAAFLVWG